MPRTRERNIDTAEKLRQSAANYEQFVLCGQQDPFQQLFATKGMKSIVGPRGSNLLALVRISNAGSRAKRYRIYANREIFGNEELQRQIKDHFLTPGDELLTSPKNNPLIRQADGTLIKLCWHHSPNHILTVSLIPARLHTYNLHVNGKGGARYNVPCLRKRLEQHGR